MKLTVYHNDELVADYSVDDQSTRSSQFDNVIYIGRSEECHIVIDDKQISRQHLKIVKKQTEWEFEKVSEMGQILVNGTVSSKSKLKNGDVLQFSGYVVNVFVPKMQDDLSTTQTAQTSPVVKNNVPITTSSMQDLDDFSNVKGLTPQVEDDFNSTKSMPAPTQTKGHPAPVTEDNFIEENVTETLAAPASEEQQHDDFLSEAVNEEANEEENLDFNDQSAEHPSTEDNNMSNEKTEAMTQNNEESADFNSASTESNYPMETESEDSGSSEGTVVFSGFATYELHLFGDPAPYDRFILEDKETFIGRNKDKCKIFLDDQEVSGVHAVIRKTNMSCTLEDLNSSNGTLVNGQRINKIDLMNGDEFVIGGTTFTVQVKSDLLQEEYGRLMPVEEGQEITKEEVIEEEVEFDGTEGSEGLDFTDGGAPAAPANKSLFDLKDPAKRKKLIYGLVILVGAYMFLGEEEPTPEEKAKTAKTATTKDSKSNLLNPEAKATVDPLAPKAAKKLDPEMEKQISFFYEKAKAHAERGEYDLAIIELKRYIDSYPDYKNTQQIMANAKQGMAKLAEIDRKVREEEERKKRKKEVEALLEKAKEAVKERQALVAEALFGQILEKDPENLDVPQLKLELEAWKKDQEKIALEKAQKEAERKRQLNLIQPGKTAYLKKDWNSAIVKLEEFLKQKDMDEDLIKEASTMLTESKNNLNDLVAPLLGQARSLKEGQDLKGAYQIYAEVLKKEPSNTEAITEMGDIRSSLDEKAKKIYREAIISESLSLFDEAKEKFQEVQQNTPTDSDYYKKATEKLKNYVE